MLDDSRQLSSLADQKAAMPPDERTGDIDSRIEELCQDLEKAGQALMASVQGLEPGDVGLDAQAPSAAEPGQSPTDIDDLAAYFASIGGETVAAGGTQTDGIEAAATCVACHGKNGISMAPTWPTLAGQHEDYLEHSLNQYRDGTRTDPVMSQMAATLTDADVKLLVAFFAGLEGLETTLPE